MTTKTFQQAYCAHIGLPASDFERSVLRRCLSPQARYFGGILNLLHGNFFAADEEFIRVAGQLSNRRDFLNHMNAFRLHPDNASLLRSTLGLSVSAENVRRLFEQHVTAVDSKAPIPAR